MLALPLHLFMAPSPRLRVVRGGDSHSDAELVERARDGNHGAEEQIYRRYATMVLALGMRLLGRRSDAEDATQDTFVIAFENLHQLRDPGALRSWLTRIAVSQARRRFRRRKLLAVLGLHNGADDTTLETLAADGLSPELRADLATLDRVLAGLPAEQRIAWMLRYVEGEELEAVANACGCSLATAKRRILAANAQVRAELRIDEEDAP